MTCTSIGTDVRWYMHYIVRRGPDRISELFRKQKAAIRIITNSRYNQHTEPLFKGTNILPLPNLCDFFKLPFMQRFIQGFLPCPFNNTWISNVARRPETVSMELKVFMSPYLDSKHWKVFHSLPFPNSEGIFQTKTSSSYTT